MYLEYTDMSCNLCSTSYVFKLAHTAKQADDATLGVSAKQKLYHLMHDFMYDLMYYLRCNLRCNLRYKPRYKLRYNLRYNLRCNLRYNLNYVTI